jgi:hypothetical protein
MVMMALGSFLGIGLDADQRLAWPRFRVLGFIVPWYALLVDLAFLFVPPLVLGACLGALIRQRGALKRGIAFGACGSLAGAFVGFIVARQVSHPDAAYQLMRVNIGGLLGGVGGGVLNWCMPHLPKNLGILLLAAWLILYGLVTLLSFSFIISGDLLELQRTCVLVLAALAVAAGVLLFLQR